jgi:hypothetical protein
MRARACAHACAPLHLPPHHYRSFAQGEVATTKCLLPTPFGGRDFHLFCSPHNLGATQVVEELKTSDVWVTGGKQPSVPLTCTTEVAQLASCDHMLVLLDERTWTSGEDTAKFVAHIHAAMHIGVHMLCVHEFPSVCGPARHAVEFHRMFHEEWTPTHLQGGAANLYKEIALALKGVEWRKPGLVAVASKLAAGGDEHSPIEVVVPTSYVAASGPNKWLGAASVPAVEVALSPPNGVALPAAGTKTSMSSKEETLTNQPRPVASDALHLTALEA